MYAAVMECRSVKNLFSEGPGPEDEVCIFLQVVDEEYDLPGPLDEITVRLPKRKMKVGDKVRVIVEPYS